MNITHNNTHIKDDIVLLLLISQLSFHFIILFKISYIGHDCKYIPDFLGDTYGQFARRLDLSFNQIR